jgi:hypothetical protein
MTRFPNESLVPGDTASSPGHSLLSQALARGAEESEVQRTSITRLVGKEYGDATELPAKEPSFGFVNE